MKNLELSISITTHEATGDVLSVYFQIRRGKSCETREFADGAAFADYDKNGYLLGIELLAPCSIAVVDQLAANEPVANRRRVKRFMRSVGPREFLAA